MKARQKDGRRGVLLLVILALLAMFGLVAVAFVLLTGQERRNAKIIQRIDQQADPPRQVLRQALMEALRGSFNPQSVIGAHNLLEDMYGNEWFLGAMTANATPLITTGQRDPNSGKVLGQLFQFPISPGDPLCRTGCVLTMLTGAAAGQSTHIVGTDSTGKFYQARAFDSYVLPAQGDGYVINGAPFSGAGFGYNSNSGRNDQKVGDLIAAVQDPKLKALLGSITDAEVALLPNLPLLVYQNPQNLQSNPPGGANSDYTAVDYQHMLLGAVVSTAMPNGAIDTRIIPSLHRPELVNYWLKRTSSANWASMAPNLLRKIMLRPNPIDHPSFTGSNPGPFNPITGPWDVDNDGDGAADSVWVDLGLPVRAASDGRLYKPLCAILCLDLDGRLNLNAHGLLAQTGNPQDANDPYYGGSRTTEIPATVAQSQGLVFAGGSQGPKPLPRGQGYGTAEINLLPLFADPQNPGQFRVDLYKKLLMGNANLALDGRYADHDPASDNNPLPGRGRRSDPLRNWDPLSCNKWFDYCYLKQGPQDNYWGFLNSPGNYLLNAWGAPPDPQGYGAVGLDLAGRPLYLSLGGTARGNQSFLNVVLNNPYCLNLSRNISRGLSSPTPAADNPFGPAELERLLRPFDRDASSLPSRLWWLTYDQSAGGSLLATPAKRHSVTTESWDLPCPSPALPPRVLGSSNLPDKRPRHVTDLLNAHGVKQQYWRELLPADLLSGLRMNLNRPYCNGWQDNYGLVVPPQLKPPQMQAQADLAVSLFARPDASAVSVMLDQYNGFPKNPRGVPPGTPQELQARYLYVLAMLLADLEYLDTKSLSGQPPGREGTCRYLAQWAVNVVDFQDRDSIMTRFPYVVVPPDPPAPAPPLPKFANGWNPTPSDTLHVVWGCERPELLISETLAFHDRRTEDLAFSDSSGKKNNTTDPGQQNPDPDFDQKKRPQGSLFVELYNPQSPLDPPSGEFYYDRTAGRWQSGVVLTQRTPGGGHPVWRLIVVKPENGPVPGEQKDPDDPLAGNRPTIERSIYFVDMSKPPPGFTADNGKVMFYPGRNVSNKIAPVLPGRYAVIGPGGIDNATGQYPTNGRYDTYIGQRTNQVEWNQTRRIILAPTFDPSTRQVDVRDNRQAGNSDLLLTPPAGSFKPATAVVIDQAKTGPRRLSVSEPPGGYPLVDPDGKPYSEASGGYPTPYDHPFDGPLDAKVDPADVAALVQTGTTFAFRVLHLQRLANPLLPYHSVSNPYRTVDSMPVDLTAFNGVTPTSVVDPTDPNQGKLDNVYFEARQRGEWTLPRDPSDLNNLWKQQPLGPKGKTKRWDPAPPADAPAGHVFTAPLSHTLGYLNKPFGDPIPASVSQFYTGDPQQGPFPWLTWNNRPFISQLELLLVPAVPSSKLLACNEDPKVRRYYDYVRVPANAVPPNTYDAPDAFDQKPYPHLLNFFHSGAAGASVPNSPQLHRLLEYVCVPSRFVGTEIQANPVEAAKAGDHAFHPPFNRIPLMREPGRINLNTIFDPAVFQGLVDPAGASQNTAALWQGFVQSRRGYGNSADPMLTPDANFPTFFARPFRSFAGAEKVPLPGMIAPREVEATLLRSDPEDPKRPLFEWQSPQPYNNTDRNPYFRYQGLQRLGNLVTTRSNVFAMWITVGYFEVAPWTAAGKPAAQMPPDGYEIGPELGSDTGEIDRHRAFFLIDRTIPAGFQRGQDLNVENVLLLQRYIE
jgi:hypothetical protein